eukprot:CAMPEP_0179921116 /NCGR_PEP_ID=MMETSP0983-20121128/4900_1 /TAXON_ID=483367 /ORGANISM="non described non described, Strain CCMP 2436" /LENGTH=101 /DNA_ID=CAMNT_0021824307 /DNA_START=85 /DNA_END=385 /DNA_ORIENTATION=+
MRLLLAVASLAALQLAAAPAPPSCLLRAGRSIRLSAMGPSAPEMHSELAQAREAAIAAASATAATAHAAASLASFNVANHPGGAATAAATTAAATTAAAHA